jgi:hypothetical protein
MERHTHTHAQDHCLPTCHAHGAQPQPHQVPARTKVLPPAVGREDRGSDAACSPEMMGVA